MKTKQYIISGCTYSAYFDTIKQRNYFNKLVNQIYEHSEKKDTAMYECISICLAEKLKVKYELRNKNN